MRHINIRDLRQNASARLREVQGGESFEITDRGRPVALLAPLPPGGNLARMVASGQIRPPANSVLDLGPPLTPVPGETLPTEVLMRMRADER